MITINWQSVAESIGVDTDRGGSVAARKALAQLLGDQALRDAVDWYVSGKPGAELARSVLWQLQPRVAMLRCKELVDSSHEERTRERAVELSRVVGDHTALEWIPNFLGDHNPGVRLWGLLIVDQLLFAQTVGTAEAGPLIQLAEAAEDDKLREHAARLREAYLSAGADEA